jgi:hypothetical protein
VGGGFCAAWRRFPGFLIKIRSRTGHDPGHERSRTGHDPSILEGSGTRMPAFRGVIGEEQLDALVAQLRAFGPAGVGAGSASAGDYDSRMRKLDEELKELQRQFWELSRAPQKP